MAIGPHSHSLEINAIVLACLSGLFGIYLILFILALWSTLRHKTPASRRLRIVTIAMFFVLLLHFITRALQFSRSRNPDPLEDETYRWGTPLAVLSNVSTTLAGFLSEGLLVWRFYVMYERTRVALYVPLTIVILNTLLCAAADVQHLVIYFEREYYEEVLVPATIWIGVVWGWVMFALNTGLTSGILLRIICMYHETRSELYASIFHAVVESAVVTWLGLLLYEILSLLNLKSPTQDPNYMDLGYIGLSIEGVPTWLQTVVRGKHADRRHIPLVMSCPVVELSKAGRRLKGNDQV